MGNGIYGGMEGNSWGNEKEFMGYLTIKTIMNPKSYLHNAVIQLFLLTNQNILKKDHFMFCFIYKVYMQFNDNIHLIMR
jgi:hypothetical protein